MADEIATLRNDRSFLLKYLGQAAVIEDGRFRLEALEEHLREGRKEAIRRSEALESELSALRAKADLLENQIAAVGEDVDWGEFLATGAFVAAGLFISMMFMAGSSEANAIATIISLGNEMVLLFEVLVLFPALISYAYQSGIAQQKADKKREALQSQLRGVKQSERSAQQCYRALKSNVVRYYTHLLKDCRAAEKEHERIRRPFYELDIVPSRYRNYLAVATMAAYIEDRRCLGLDGPGGAVDTLAHECLIVDSVSALRSQMADFQRQVCGHGSAGALVSRYQGQAFAHLATMDSSVREQVQRIQKTCKAIERGDMDGKSYAELPPARHLESFYQGIARSAEKSCRGMRKRLSA